MLALTTAQFTGCGTQISFPIQKIRATREAQRKHFEDPDVARHVSQLAMAKMADLYATLDKSSREKRTVTAPRLVKAVSPQYPLSRRIKDVQGGVWIAFAADVEGNTTRIESIPEAGAIEDPAFVEAAKQAVRQWKFEPGKIDGTPIVFPLCVPVVFELE